MKPLPGWASAGACSGAGSVAGRKGGAPPFAATNRSPHAAPCESGLPLGLRGAIQMLGQGFRRIVALGAVLTLAAALAGCGINNIPSYEQTAKAKWSEVLSQYKRRADLIPNLVETVKGFADQEKSVLTSVT